jgi:hypothetical protein
VDDPETAAASRAWGGWRRRTGSGGEPQGQPDGEWFSTELRLACGGGEFWGKERTERGGGRKNREINSDKTYFQVLFFFKLCVAVIYGPGACPVVDVVLTDVDCCGTTNAHIHRTSMWRHMLVGDL